MYLTDEQYGSAHNFHVMYPSFQDRNGGRPIFNSQFVVKQPQSNRVLTGTTGRPWDLSCMNIFNIDRGFEFA
jgi:hypothetical protein